MRTALAFLCIALAALAASQAKPAKKPKPKKLGPQVIILKVLDHTGATGEASVLRYEYARAGLLNGFNKRKIISISPAEIQGTIDQLQIDFSKTDTWTPDNFERLSDPWSAAFVAGETLDAVDETKPSKKGDRIMATVSVTLWLYSVKDHKFIAQSQPLQKSYTSMKGEETADAKATEYEAIAQASDYALRAAFKDKK